MITLPVIDGHLSARSTGRMGISSDQHHSRPKSVHWEDSEDIWHDGGPSSKKRKLSHISEAQLDVAAPHLPPRNRRKQLLALHTDSTTDVIPSPGSTGGRDSLANTVGGSTANLKHEKHVHHPIASISATSHDESDALGSKIASLVHHIQDVAAQATRYRNETTRRAVITDIRHQETLDDIKQELSIAKESLLKEKQEVERLTEERDTLKKALQLEREEASKLAERVAYQGQVNTEELDALKRTLQDERKAAMKLAEQVAQQLHVDHTAYVTLENGLRNEQLKSLKLARELAWQQHVNQAKVAESPPDIAQLKEALLSQQQELATLQQMAAHKMKTVASLHGLKGRNCKATLVEVQNTAGIRNYCTEYDPCLRKEQSNNQEQNTRATFKTDMKDRFDIFRRTLRPEEVAPHIVKKEFLDVVEKLDFFQQPASVDNMDSRLLEFSVRVVQSLSEFESEA